MLEARNIVKSYGDLTVLNGIDLKIEKSEVVSIVGSSGAGKTTLLQILGTLEKPSSGQVLYHGKDVSRLSGDELARFRNKHIGFIFQFHQLLPEFTALENVCIPAYIAKKKKADAVKRGRELLAFLKLDGRENHKPNELSGGEQQRVAVARALMNNPDIIFADEPSGNLDTENANELHDLFFKLREEFQQTFVLVTHNEKLANQTDRSIRIKDGVLV
jgi:lipoprotein-releasing system ATP-binding protein